MLDQLYLLQLQHDLLAQFVVVIQLTFLFAHLWKSDLDLDQSIGREGVVFFVICCFCDARHHRFLPCIARCDSNHILDGFDVEIHLSLRLEGDCLDVMQVTPQMRALVKQFPQSISAPRNFLVLLLHVNNNEYL